ncbi:MAG: methylamine dehydrogenase accessory protein MauD [Gammaproteobacteria bacterium]
MNALTISNVLLWIALIVLVVIVIALARQIGVLYERIAPAGALMVNAQLKVGMAAPDLDLETITGKPISVGATAANGRSQLLFFLSPDCPVCRSFLPIIRAGSKSERTWLDVVLASDGDDVDHGEYIAEHHLTGFPYVISRSLGMAYGVAKLPYAVLVDGAGKIASMGIVNSREHLDSLFEAKERNVASIQEYLSQTQRTGNNQPGNQRRVAGDH